MSRFLVTLTPGFISQAWELDGFTGGVDRALSEHYEWLAEDPFLGSVVDSRRGLYAFRTRVLDHFLLTFVYRMNVEGREVEMLGVSAS